MNWTAVCIILYLGILYLGHAAIGRCVGLEVPENQRMNAEKKRRQMFLLEDRPAKSIQNHHKIHFLIMLFYFSKLFP